MTLEEVLRQSETGDVKSALTALVDYFKKQDEVNLADITAAFNQLAASFGGLSEGQGAIKAVLETIAAKEIVFPEIPEPKDVLFPKVQKVSMDKPSWYQAPDSPEAIAKALGRILAPVLDRLAATVVSEGLKTREILTDILNKEPDEQPRPASVGVGAATMKAQWFIATFPQLGGTEKITRKDGTLNAFFLPSGVIPNSETIRLNQGIPLSHGIDYTLTGNLVTFTRDIQNDEYMEVRAQR